MFKEKMKTWGLKIGTAITRFWFSFKRGCVKIVAWFKKVADTKFGFYFKKVFKFVALVFVIIQFIFGVMIYGFHLDNKATQVVSKIVPYPVAVVNYNFITMAEFQGEKDYIHHFYSATEQSNIDYTEIDSQILDQLIEDKIVEAEAIKYKVKIAKSEIDDTVNNISVQNGGQDQVEKVLNDLYGLTLSDFKRLIRIQLLRDKLNETVITHITARHILIQVDSDATDDAVNTAKTKIDGIKTEIDNGLDFAEAAKKYSEDSGSASNGGLLESFTVGDMVQEFSDAAFAANVGEVVGPVRTEYGWHLIKVESRTGSINESFSDWLGELEGKSLIMKFYKIS